MQLLIMGCGRVGAKVALDMAEAGNRVFIMDTETDRFLRLPAHLLESERIVAIIGDGTQEEDLRKADIEEADVFVAVGDRETGNLLAAQIAKHIFKVPKVVCRTNDPLKQEIYSEMGLLAVSPTGVISGMILDAINQP